MRYAHITAGVVDQIGHPPALAFDGTRWWDLRPLDPALLAQFGWLPLVEATRPADTAATTWDRGNLIGADTVTVTWTERAKTADELAADAARANEATIRSRATNALNTNAAFLAIASPTNAQVLAQVKALTREASGLIRLTLNAPDSISDT